MNILTIILVYLLFYEKLSRSEIYSMKKKINK